MSSENELYETLMELPRSVESYRAFFHDLCTPSELEAMSQRWQIAQLLEKGDLSYREIQEKTRASLTTVGRVARFLSHENNQGYALALKRQSKRITNETQK